MLHRPIQRFLIAVLGGLASCAPWQQAGPDASEAIGSLRHSRVAIPTDGGKRELTYLAASLNEEDLAAVQASVPNLRVLVPESAQQALELAPRAHGADARHCTPEFLEAAGQLVWVQSPSAGVERYLRLEALRDDDGIVLTNMQGAHGATIAEHVFAMLLVLTRDLRCHLQEERRGWNRAGSGVEPVALSGRTILVVGLGGIGSEVARRAKGFDMRVLATRRSAVGSPPYVDVQRTPDELLDLLAEADVAVVCVPLTEETTGMIDATALAAMKPGGFLVNISRGPVVDTAALVDALRSGHLAGACLDVTDPEPLPEGHALWAMPNVVITPHVAARSAVTDAQWKRLYVENLRRFGAGEPLLNVVDKAAGY
jgi:phosphoglycerate dehydrogenase-like enzyme